MIMIPLFVLLIHNRFVNGHYHRLPNGQVVYHYHPYAASTTGGSTGSPFAAHHHTTLDFSIITSIFGGEIFVGLVFLFAGFLLIQQIHRLIIQVCLFFNRLKVRYSDSRAPPCIA